MSSQKPMEVLKSGLIFQIINFEGLRLKLGRKRDERHVPHPLQLNESKIPRAVLPVYTGILMIY